MKQSLSAYPVRSTLHSKPQFTLAYGQGVNQSLVSIPIALISEVKVEPYPDRLPPRFSNLYPLADRTFLRALII